VNGSACGHGFDGLCPAGGPDLQGLPPAWNSRMPYLWSEVTMMEQADRQPSRTDQLTLLAQCGPGTPMGQLLRTFWQPVALSESVARGTARPLRVLGEDLTLYRGESGKVFLVGGRCAHRCTVLHTGWVKDDQIRCMYHGWRYDGSGLCTEIPAEKKPRTIPIRIEGYPLHEYCGLVFAYLGPAPTPEFDLPRKEFLEAPGRFLFARQQIWDCNWFQQVENSLDAVHVSFVHVWGMMSRFGEEITTAIPDLSYTETNAGIRQRAMRSRTNVRISDWTFPNNNHIVAPGPKKTDPWVDNCVWAVPIDDTHTMRFTVTAVPSTDSELTSRLAQDRNPDYEPTEHIDLLFGQHRLPETGSAQVIASQDYVAVRGQGAIVDRASEHLSQSDAGIALLRRIFWRELGLIQEGRPTKAWSRLDEAPVMSKPGESATGH
jgi:5,5'-dehydrodivanillate O-demethylase